MSRSVKKGPFVQEVLYKRVVAMNEAGEKKVLKTWSRSSTIFPEFVGHTFLHSGYWNINQFSIVFASRLPLRSRLTLIRLALFRKPWVFCVGISIPIIVTYAYIFFSRRSRVSNPVLSPRFRASASVTDSSDAFAIGVLSDI